MPFPQNKKERALQFARNHGEAKRKLYPDNPEDWLIDVEVESASKKCTDGTPYEAEIEYKRYRRWPDCPWPNPWRVEITHTVERKDIGWPGEGHVTFGAEGEFCETREEALESAHEEMNSMRTF